MILSFVLVILETISMNRGLNKECEPWSSNTLVAVVPFCLESVLIGMYMNFFLDLHNYLCFVLFSKTSKIFLKITLFDA